MDRIAAEVNALWRKHWTTIILLALLLAFTRLGPRLPKSADPQLLSSFFAEAILSIVLALVLSTIIHWIVRFAYKKMVNKNA